MVVYSKFLKTSLVLALFCLPSFAARTQTTILTQPHQSSGKYTFAPNQLAAAEYYQPLGHVINGHIGGSFTDINLWPTLFGSLQKTGGSFGIHAAEVGHLNSDQLLLFRNAGIAVSTEMPAWTQCYSGRVLGQTEILGQQPKGQNLFQSIFHITTAGGRYDPTVRGWLVTKDGQDYAPDEVVLDERIPALLPTFNGAVLITPAPGLTWGQRKAQARIDPCPAADGFHPQSDRVTGLILDYLDYAQIMASRFPNKPAFSFHWNVNPGWEWGDEQCLDTLNSLYPDPTAFATAFINLTNPCHRDTAILSQLLDVLCGGGACPKTVFMDMDLHYQTGYSLDVLRRNKTVLQQHGVSFGIDLTDECNAVPACIQVSPAAGQMTLVSKNPSDPESENMLDQKSLLNKFDFLRANGILDGNTQIRFESFTVRPFEQGPQIAETIPGSYANTTMQIINDLSPLACVMH